MKHLRVIILALLLMLLATPLVALASNITNARYWAQILVSNNGTATTNVAVPISYSLNTTNLINGNYLNATATNSVMRSSSGADIPFMPGYTPNGAPWYVWVNSIGANTYLTDILYTANSTGGELRYFPGPAGMDTSDNASLEPGANFTYEAKGWFDTTVSGNITTKGADFAIKTDGSGNITADAELELVAPVLHFDGINDEVTAVSAFGDVNFQLQAFTIEFWAKQDAGSPGAGLILYLGATTAANHGVSVIYDSPANNQFVVGFNQTDRGIAGRIAVRATVINGDITTANWNHFAITHDGTGVPNLARTKIYFNGVSVADNTFISTYCGIQQNTIRLGDAGVGGFFWKGEMDECNITNDVRTPVEILADYNLGLLLQGMTADGNTQWLVHMNEGAGFVLNDTSGNGNNGVITSATWLTRGATTSTSLSASGVSPSELTVAVSANVTHLRLHIDGTLEDTYTLNGYNIPDNADNWVSFTDNATMYAEYQHISVNGTLQQDIEWAYGTTFPDLSGNSHPATPTFRTLSSDADVSANMTAFMPVSQAQAGDYILGAAPAFIDASGLVGNITAPFTIVPPTPGFPLAGVIAAVAAATSTPAQLPLLLIAVICILATSLSVSALIRQKGSGSIIIKIIAITAVMGIFIALRNFGIDFWMLCFFLVISIAMAMASKQLGWT